MFAKVSKLMSLCKGNNLDFSKQLKMLFFIIFLKRFLIKRFKLVPFILYLQTQ